MNSHTALHTETLPHEQRNSTHIGPKERRKTPTYNTDGSPYQFPGEHCSIMRPPKDPNKPFYGDSPNQIFDCTSSLPSFDTAKKKAAMYKGISPVSEVEVRKNNSEYFRRVIFKLDRCHCPPMVNLAEVRREQRRGSISRKRRSSCSK